jgi:hypothetical protein
MADRAGITEEAGNSACRGYLAVGGRDDQSRTHKTKTPRREPGRAFLREEVYRTVIALLSTKCITRKPL